MYKKKFDNSTPILNTNRIISVFKKKIFEHILLLVIGFTVYSWTVKDEYRIKKNIVNIICIFDKNLNVNI